MQQMRLTHRQIEAFRALMLTGSFTEAARFLSVTQPAVSKIISQLEEELGFALFERIQGKISATEDAHILYSEVEQSYRGLDCVKRAARRIKNNSGGSLHIAVMPALAVGFIAQVIKRLYEQDGDLELSLHGYGSDEIVELVASGLFDLGFVTTPVDTSQVTTGPVLSTPSFCILPPDHHLSAKREISVFDLEGEKIITTPEGAASRLRIDSLLSSLNISRTQIIEARWSLTIAELVQAGLGCSIVDGFTASAFAQRGGLVKPLVESLDFSFTYITSKTCSKTKIVKRFNESFDQEFKTFKDRLLSNSFIN
ncbi:LysR substrate-binding domain-containing protein [Marinobacterium lutimaris]|uniref:Transcriptional regulator, LysR family n=1 Tax=Marinobacterium lutimaris TaxID=568106 RepID=A0A1H6CB13_9GAMM|nr:LysR substrate-binding domain-containing protein [Marinobacterium lutimaris]SEG70124.1 transcriptional regulator, LysR family [Marinobacterium lutimaris]